MSKVRRRRFLIASGALLAAPFPLLAQEPGAVRTIGFLALDYFGVEADPKKTDPRSPAPPAGLAAQVLAKHGWIEGKNLVIERAVAEAEKTERLAEFAEALVRKRVELIIAWGDLPTLAAARATSTIPIVFYSGINPVERGFIDSFARPGRNITGTSWQTGVEVSVKRLQFLREIAPSAKRLSWILPGVGDVVETVAGSRVDLKPDLQKSATSLGFETRFHTEKSLETAFSEILAWRAHAISAASTPDLRHRIAEFALRHRLPSAFLLRENVEAGGLLSYAPPLSEWQAMHRRSMEYVDRILRGARPGDLPVERPSRYELTINLKTAKTLGLELPQSILVRADRVIE